MADTASPGRLSRALPVAGYSSQAQLAPSRARAASGVPRTSTTPTRRDAIAHQETREERYTRINRGERGAAHSLAHQQIGVARELVGRDLEVQGRRALADAARDVVVGAVAGAEPAAVVARVGNWHTS